MGGRLNPAYDSRATKLMDALEEWVDQKIYMATGSTNQIQVKKLKELREEVAAEMSHLLV